MLINLNKILCLISVVDYRHKRELPRWSLDHRTLSIHLPSCPLNLNIDTIPVWSMISVLRMTRLCRCRKSNLWGRPIYCQVFSRLIPNRDRGSHQLCNLKTLLSRKKRVGSWNDGPKYSLECRPTLYRILFWHHQEVRCVSVRCHKSLWEKYRRSLVLWPWIPARMDLFCHKIGPNFSTIYNAYNSNYFVDTVYIILTFYNSTTNNYNRHK